MLVRRSVKVCRRFFCTSDLQKICPEVQQVCDKLSTWSELDEHSKKCLMNEIESVARKSPLALANVAFSLEQTNNTCKNNFPEGKELLHVFSEDAVHAVLSGQLTFRQCARLARNFSSVGVPHKELMYAVANAAVPASEEILAKKPTDEQKKELGENLQRTAFALAKGNIEHGRFFDHLERVFPNLVDHCDERTICQLLWSFASLKRYNEDFFSTTVDVITRRASDLQLTGISTILWSLATTAPYRGPSPHARAFARVAADILQAKPLAELEKCSTRSLVMMTRSFVKLSNEGRTVADWLAPTLGYMTKVIKVEDCNAQDLSIIAWAHATANINSEILDNVYGRVKTILPEFNCQGLSNLLWASSKLERRDLPVLSAIVNLLSKKPNLFWEASPESLAHIAAAYAKATFWSPLIFSTIAKELDTRENVPARDLVQIARSYTLTPWIYTNKIYIPKRENKNTKNNQNT